MKGDAGTATGRADRTWRPWTIAVPATTAGVVTVVLGSLGWMGVGIGVVSPCTDRFSCTSGTCAPCLQAGIWVTAGGAAQWALAVAALVLLVLGLRRPGSRRSLAFWAWAITPLAVGWLALAAVKASHSY